MPSSPCLPDLQEVIYTVQKAISFDTKGSAPPKKEGDEEEELGGTTSAAVDEPLPQRMTINFQGLHPKAMTNEEGESLFAGTEAWIRFFEKKCSHLHGE